MHFDVKNVWIKRYSMFLDGSYSFISPLDHDFLYVCESSDPIILTITQKLLYAF